MFRRERSETQDAYNIEMEMELNKLYIALSCELMKRTDGSAIVPSALTV